MVPVNFGALENKGAIGVLVRRFRADLLLNDGVTEAHTARENPAPGDLDIRAILLKSMSHRDQTTGFISDALREFDTLEALDPGNQNIASIPARIE